MIKVQSKTRNHEMRDTDYVYENGYKVGRENGYTPNGNKIDYRWVLRDNEGNFIDIDTYLNDMTERHSLEYDAY